MKPSKLNKWRPGHKCWYVIPEIAGNIESFDVLLKRILPLRKHIGQEDRVVFLGNYLVGNLGGSQVLDRLIQVQAEYPDRCVCLRGRDEDRLLKAIKGSEQDYRDFIGSYNGNSIVASYLNQAQIETSAFNFPQARLKDIIPKVHLEFLEGLPYYHREEQYCFFWGGINLHQSIEQNSLSNFVADTSTVKIIGNLITAGRLEDVEKLPVLQEITCIASYNANRKKPFISEKWMSLAIGAPNNLGCFDLETMEMIRIKQGRERPYKLII